MLRTRVGYCGGTKDAPTYRDLGDHTEAIEIDFDPTVISYADLLDTFFATHNACASGSSRQYMSALWYRDAAQKQAIDAAIASVERERGTRVRTHVAKLERFWLAEDYHQKYYLRRARKLAEELLAIYPKLADFVDSTATARINGWVAGHGKESMLANLDRVGLSSERQAELRRLARR